MISDVRTTKRMLAQYMLEWEEKKVELDDLEDEIKRIVLKLGQTVEISNVKASYRKGATTYDYYGAIEAAEFSAEDLEKLEFSKDKHSKVSITTSWKEVCADMELEPPVKSQGDPSVTVKLC